MLLRRAALVLTLILLLAAAGLALWVWRSQNLFSSPTAVRTNFSYDRANAPGTNIPPVPENIFSSITIRQDTNQLELEFPDFAPSSWDSDYGSIAIQRADGFHSVRINNGSVHLAFLAGGYTVARTNIGWGMRLPAKYLTPDLKPFPPEQATALLRNPRQAQTIQFDGEFPGATFVFACSNLSEFKPLRFSAYDARTKHPLSSSYTTAALTNVFWHDSTIRLWHQTPIELYITLATGPAQIHTLPPKIGAEFSYSGGVVRLLAIAPAEFSGSSSSTFNSTNHLKFEYGQRYPSDTDQRSRTSLVFFSWPSSSLQGELEVLGHDGKKLPTHGGGSHGTIVVSTVIGRLEDIKEVRLLHYPNLHRLIFTIPELPGLPEQNRNLANLFDAHIPYMRFRYEYAFQSDIAQLLQMQNHSIPLTFTNNYFPIFRTNTTTRELFREMASLLSDPEKRIVVDPESNTIQAKRHPLAVLLNNVKKTLGLPP